ncbi:MAG TPA: hypothetical protein VKA84_00650, partial [Gemmatimonadaceae bacterium]|nr:hypothetical protein [Gemmatimonadaceae bacterium]
PDDANTVIAVMSGFGTGHVWRGVVPSGGGATTWTNVSGAGGAGPLPDIPVNALAIDPASPNTYYVGTDVGVFRTTNAGATWAPMSQGLPNCAVFDLRLHAPTRLLRAATHGRGLWERRLDVPSVSAADLYVRDHLMATGRVLPSPSGVAAAFEDLLQHLALGDPCFWWQCADIKVDALEGAIPTYGIPAVADVDYVAFESRLEHRNAQRGSVNRVYVQVHNRGFAAAAGVTVKLLYADASAGLPPLPADFWTAFPGNAASTAVWHPIGAAKVIPTLSATEPVVLEWDWSTPPSAADHSCLLAVMDCPADPIPSASKVLDVNALVRNEKRVGLKNLHVVNAPPATIFWSLLRFFASSQTASQVIRFLPSAARGWSVGVLLPAGAAPAAGVTGLTTQKPTAAQLKAFKTRFGEQAAAFDTTRLYVLGDLRQGGQLAQIKVPKAGLTAALVFVAPDATTATTATLTVLQEDAAKVVVGGNTYALRVTKQK